MKQDIVRKTKRSGLTNADRKAIAGRLFILPWFIGLVIFFIIPFVQSLIFTFNKIGISSKGITLKFVGFYNYIYAFTTDTDFVTSLKSSLQAIVPNVLIIVFFSLFVAMILRSDFKGKTFARAIFFLPVIISSGVVVAILKENIMAGSSAETVNQASYLFQVPSFAVVLDRLGLPSQITGGITTMINQLFDLTWKSGVQILLLLAAVNNIPKSSYEVADIEGATEWEKFWKITFPMASPTLLVAVIYTAIDYFTDYGNAVMRYVTKLLSSQGAYEYSSTLAFIYFICVFAIIGIIGFIISRYVFYMSD